MMGLRTKFLAGFAVAAGVGLFAFGGGTAQAAGLGFNFDIDQSCGGSGLCSELGGTLTNVDSINFRYSALVEQQQAGGTFLDGDDPFVEIGFMNWTGYLDDAANPVGPSTLNFDYGVYGLFSATGTAGLSGGGGIDVVFSSFAISFFMDDNADTTLALPAPVAPIGAPVVGNTGDDILLATATLLSAGEAHVFTGLANGDFEVVLSDLGLSLLGQSFFTNPSPFYKIIGLTGVTTQVIGADPLNPFVATLTGSGDLYVPEPGTLAIFGVGLLGLGLARRRRKA